MWPYLLIFSLFLLNAIIHIRPSLLSIKDRYWSIEWVFIFILLVVFVGFRYKVGADWDVYYKAVEKYSFLGEARDFGYDFLVWLAVIFDQEIVLVNVISAIFFSYGLVIFCRNQTLSSLSMLVAFPYIVTVVAMGYTRQSIVLGLFMLGLVQLENGNFWRYIGLIIFAALFHSSAIVLLPLAIVVVERYLFIKILTLVLFLAVTYFFVLDEVVDYVKSTYFDVTFTSPGTMIRFVLLLFPALLFLFNINRLKINEISTSIYVIRLWTVVALSTFVMVIPLLILPSYTVIDRILLYWLPLQLFVFGNIPAVYINNKYIYYIIYITIILYSTLVFVAWLFFSNNSHMWIPYSNYLWL